MYLHLEHDRRHRRRSRLAIRPCIDCDRHKSPRPRPASNTTPGPAAAIDTETTPGAVDDTENVAPAYVSCRATDDVNVNNASNGTVTDAPRPRCVDRQSGLSRSLLNFASDELPVSAPSRLFYATSATAPVGRGQRVHGLFAGGG